MARLTRCTIAGLPHLVVQKGAGRLDVFRSDEDYLYYLESVRRCSESSGVAVRGYVLLPAGAHLLLCPETSLALSHFMQELSRRYVRWFNARYLHSGTIWGGRFRSCVLDPAWELEACRYLEELPVRLGFVLQPGQYVWSSYAHHTGTRVDEFLSDSPVLWALGDSPQERARRYRQMCATPQREWFGRYLEKQARRGWPAGEEPFVRSLPVEDGRRRPARRQGRPRREKQ